MEDRNPYAAPKVPVVAAPGVDHQFGGEADELEYGGFWRRFGASLLDGLIASPVTVGLLALLYFTRNAYVYSFLPSILFSLFYYVWLVERYGGTPGKRILGMRISMVDGTRVTRTAALIRNLPMLIFTVLTGIAEILATFSLGDVEFESLGILGKITALQAVEPPWNKPLSFVLMGWFVVGAIVLISNPRKRAVHDFLARTMVVRTD